MMEGRTVLVTGSSRGIGRAVAKRLVAERAKVIVHFTQHEAEAIAVKKELGEGVVGLVRADLAQPGSARELWTRANAIAPVTDLVNNAGVYHPLNFLESSDAEFEANHERTMQINFSSPLELCRFAAKAFAEKGGGSIVNVASRVGFRGEAGAALYSASKAALINITRALAVELAPRHVRLFGIAPGWVETAMARDGMNDRLPQILKDIPAGRMASPEDCAQAVAFLLDPRSNYLTGVVIDINGASYFH